MNPEQNPYRGGPQGEQPPQRPQFERNPMPQNGNPEMQPEYQPPQSAAPANPYSAPDPGPYQPDYTPPPPNPNPAHIPDQPRQQQPMSSPNIPANQVVEKKRAQARKLLFVAIAAAILFVIGIGVVIALSLSGGNTDDVDANLTVDEQLAADLNTFGLGVVNFNKGGTTFTLEQENVAVFRTNYIPRDFTDPRTNEPYTVTNEIPEVGEIQYIPGGVCNEDDSISQSGNESNFAARILLESGTLLCIEPSEVKVPSSPTN